MFAFGCNHTFIVQQIGTIECFVVNIHINVICMDQEDKVEHLQCCLSKHNNEYEYMLKVAVKFIIFSKNYWKQ